MDERAANRTTPRGQAGAGNRGERDLAVDLEVGLRIEGYHWVEWNHRAIGEAPLDEPGRFVGHPGDLLAHLYVAAGEEVPLSASAFTRLPRYSIEPGPAIRAAERAGLFQGEGVVLSCSASGTWTVVSRRLEMVDDCLPRLLSRAALGLVRERDPGGDL